MRGLIETGVSFATSIFVVGLGMRLFGPPTISAERLMGMGVIVAILAGILFLIWMAIRGIRATMKGSE
jgi:hypothetical protein